MKFLTRNWWSILNLVIMVAIVWGDWHTKDRSVVNSNFFLIGIAVVLMVVLLRNTAREWRRPTWYRDFDVNDMKDMGVSGIFAMILCVDVLFLSPELYFRVLAVISFAILGVLVHHLCGEIQAVEDFELNRPKD